MYCVKELGGAEDFTESLVKQEIKVVKAAIFQAVQPAPSTFRPPKYRMNISPAMEIIRYTGGREAFQMLARTAERS